MKFREEDFVLSQVRLDYSIVNEDMDFYIRDRRVLVNGNFDLSNEDEIKSMISYLRKLKG